MALVQATRWKDSPCERDERLSVQVTASAHRPCGSALLQVDVANLWRFVDPN